MLDLDITKKQKKNVVSLFLEASYKESKDEEEEGDFSADDDDEEYTDESAASSSKFVYGFSFMRDFENVLFFPSF